MRRWHLVELEDLPWWPRVFRNALTDVLVVLMRFSKVYAGMVPRLAAALQRNGSTQIIDLCSGGGGPWAELLPELRAAGVEASVCLTDKYPNTEALARAANKVPGLQFETASVSATDVPARLAGFRTMFTSFHHFRPEAAQAILAAAVRDRQGIAIAEPFARRSVVHAFFYYIGACLLIPLSIWLLTPVIRPFRWSRLFWTYIIPMVPLVVLFDGLVSYLRIYTPEEMLTMAREVGGESYDWQAGFDYPARSPIPIPYLIGVPRPDQEVP